MYENYPQPQEAPQPPVPLYNKLLERGREGRSEWWRYCLGFILSILVGYQIIGIIPLCILVIRAIALKYVTLSELLADSTRMLDASYLHVSKNIMLIALMFIFVGAALFLWIAVRFIHKRPFMSVISGISNKFDFRRYFFAFGMWLVLCCAQLFIALQVNPELFHLTFDPVPFFGGLIILLIFLPIQTGWEEVFMRGYLMQGLGGWMKKSLWPWIITSVVFGLLHLMNNEVKVNGVLVMLPQYILPGMIFGAMALMDERLEIPMGMHFANNLFGILTVSSPDSSIKANSIWEISTVPGGEDAFLGAGLQLLVFFIFFFVYRWDFKKLYK